MLSMSFNGCKFLSGLALCSVMATAANAEIIIHGTRVIYPSDAREVTLQLSNNGSKPALVQAWIDEGDPKSTPDQSKVPFMITPPISRVEPTKSQTLRITALPNALQLDQKQETVFWLNVLDIPPRPTGKGTETVPDNRAIPRASGTAPDARDGWCSGVRRFRARLAATGATGVRR